jgi:hypothetical protein
MIKPGNIWSGSKTLAVLTNPTRLAKKKGNLKGNYPVEIDGISFQDAEAAFWHLVKQEGAVDLPHKFQICVRVIEAKLEQHPRIKTFIDDNGGVEFLEQCYHRTEAYQEWGGSGYESSFVCALISAYAGACPRCGCSCDHTERHTEGCEHLAEKLHRARGESQ